MSRRITRKTNSEASAISDRSGQRFPMSEMVIEPGTGWLVHKSESDGEYSLNKHPLNNEGKYLKGKFGDPYPVPNARPRTSEETDTSVKYRASSVMSAKSTLTSFAKIFVYTAAMLCSSTTTSSATRTLVGASTTAATSTVSASANNVISLGVASLSASSSVGSAGGLRTLAVGESSITGTGTLTAVGFGDYLGSTTLSGTGTLTASGLGSYVGSSSMTGTATVAAVGSVPGWEKTGNSFSVNTDQATGMTSTRIAISLGQSPNQLRTYDFDGTDWSQTGNSLTISGSGTLALASLDSTTIAVFDISSDELETYTFDGTDWSQTGNSLTITNAATQVKITGLSSTRIAYTDIDNDELRTYDWDGTDWSQTGNSLALPAFSANHSSTVIDTNTICLGINNTLYTYSFDGTDWSQVGNSLSAGADAQRIEKLRTNVIVTMDTVADELKAYSWDGTDWTADSVVYNDGTTTFNGDMAYLEDNVIVVSDGSSNILQTYTYTE